MNDPDPPRDAADTLRVLLVEDDLVIARATARWLKRRGYPVVLVATADEAEAAIGRGSADVIVTDWSLATSTAQHVVVVAAAHQVPLVVFSGGAPDGAAGASPWIQKTDLEGLGRWLEAQARR